MTAVYSQVQISVGTYGIPYRQGLRLLNHPTKSWIMVRGGNQNDSLRGVTNLADLSQEGPLHVLQK